MIMPDLLTKQLLILLSFPSLIKRNIDKIHGLSHNDFLSHPNQP